MTWGDIALPAVSVAGVAGLAWTLWRHYFCRVKTLVLNWHRLASEDGHEYYVVADASEDVVTVIHHPDCALCHERAAEELRAAIAGSRPPPRQRALTAAEKSELDGIL